MLQSDRDRYLLNGIAPPGPFKRLTVHFLFPLAIFLTAGMVATHVSNQRLNQALCIILIGLLIIYWCTQCYKGRRKRIGIRKDLLWLKHQMALQQQDTTVVNERTLLSLLEHGRRPRYHHESGDEEDDEDRYGHFDDDDDDHDDYGMYLGQTRRDVHCAHPCCLIGFYAEDRRVGKERNVPHDIDNYGDFLSGSSSTNLCRRLYTLSCCLWPQTSLCGMHVQCCGVCAIAQEGREIESTLLPVAYRRIDYLSMQSVLDYYPAIYHRRWQEVGAPSDQQEDGARGALLLSNTTVSSPSSWWCFPKWSPPLSRLSHRLLQSLVVVTVALFLWAVLGPLYWKYVVHTANRSHAFAFYDFLIYVATITQSVVLLSVLVWFVNRSQRPTIQTCELSLDAMIKFFFSGFCLSTSLAIFWELVVSIIVRMIVALSMAIAGVDPETAPDYNLHNGNGWMGSRRSLWEDVESLPNHWKAWKSSSWLLPTVSGPLLSTASSGSPSVKEWFEAYGNDHPVFYAFYLLVEAFLLAALIEELCKYFGYRMVEHPDFLSKDELTDASRILMGENDNLLDEGNVPPELRDPEDPSNQNVGSRQLDYSKQGQSIQARGANITIAMICTAMGFTCCENLVYVFFYSSSSPWMELAVLISRSFFPVHPIAAAIQSVGVCKRDLEGMRNYQVGWIIFPSILFHGTYDFFLLLIDFLTKRNGIYAENDGDAASDEDNIVSLILSFFVSLSVMGAAIFYLSLESRRQRQRLAAMDLNTNADRSRLI